MRERKVVMEEDSERTSRAAEMGAKGPEVKVRRATWGR